MKLRTRIAVALLLVGAGVAVGAGYFSDEAVQEAKKRQAESARANIYELIPGNLNSDGVVDVVAIYEPFTKDDATNEVISVMEAYDGVTGAVLWASEIAGGFKSVPSREVRSRRFVVDEVNDVIVVSGRKHQELAPTGGTMWAFSRKTGALVWERIISPEETVRDGFRLWLHNGRLLTHTQTSDSAGSRAAFMLHSIDPTNGRELWATSVGRLGYGYTDGELVPFFVGDDIVVTLKSIRGDARMFVIDSTSGSSYDVPIGSLEFNNPIVSGGQLYVTCEEHKSRHDPEVILPDCKKSQQYYASLAKRCATSDDDDCQIKIDASLSERGWLARLDTSRKSLEPVLATDGSIVSMPNSTHSGLRKRFLYKNLVLQADDKLCAVDLVTGAGAWCLPERESNTTFYWYFFKSLREPKMREIPTRYVPMMGEVGSPAVSIVDMETGGLAWASTKRAEGTDRSNALYHEGNYYFNLATEAGTVLVRIDGTTGTFSGAFQVALDGTAKDPSARSSRDVLGNAWYFNGDRLVGWWGQRHLWSLNLASKRLGFSHPKGVELVHAWEPVEAVLGTMPRSAAEPH